MTGAQIASTFTAVQFESALTSFLPCKSPAVQYHTLAIPNHEFPVYHSVDCGSHLYTSQLILIILTMSMLVLCAGCLLLNLPITTPFFSQITMVQSFHAEYKV